MERLVEIAVIIRNSSSSSSSSDRTVNGIRLVAVGQ